MGASTLLHSESLSWLNGACLPACLSGCLPACLPGYLSAWSCLQLVMEVMKKLEGAYALLIKSRHYPGEMVAAKRGSPMIVGIKEGSNKKNAPSGGLAHRWGAGRVEQGREWLCVCQQCMQCVRVGSWC